MSTEQKTPVKRKRIIDAALSAFLQRDVNKTTMDEIAETAGVSKVTIYKYFGDKDGLIYYSCLHIITQYIDMIDQQINAKQPLSEKLTGLTDILTRFIQSGYQDLCGRLSALNNDAKEAHAFFQKRKKDAILTLIDEGKEAALLYKDVDNESVYHYINMGLCYFQHDIEYRNRVMYDARFRDSFMSLIWRNIFIDRSPFDQK